MFIVDDIIIGCGIALLTALIVTALTVVAWLVSVAMKRLISFIKDLGVRSAVGRKKDAINKFIKAAEKNGELEIAQELKRVRDAHKALLVPLNGNGEEIWNELQVVGVENKDQDNMVNAFMFADTGRVKAL